MYKDLFSQQSQDYAKFRPLYPNELFEYLAFLSPAHDLAWDCGTGNGQAAVKLAAHFKKVLATDPSEKQLAQAERHAHVDYQVATAEHSGIESHSVDLITVAQAFHWFEHERFFKEAKRVLKPQGILAIWCYELAEISPEVDEIVFDLYKNILGDYWEKERKLVEEGYRTITIPMEELKPPPFDMNANWSLDHLMGYLGTWSALQKYIKKNEASPLPEVRARLEKLWPSNQIKKIRWPLSVRVCRFQG